MDRKSKLTLQGKNNLEGNCLLPIPISFSAHIQKKKKERDPALNLTTS